MRPSLADRLREIVVPRGGVSPVPRVQPAADEGAGAAPPLPRARTSSAGLRAAAGALGGEWHEETDGPVIIVDRVYPPEARHGRLSIGEMVERLEAGAEALGVLGRAWPSAGGFLPRLERTAASEEAGAVPALAFLDLETTGLAGGAGTQAFLVGCATVHDGGVRVRQFVLPGFEHERALLAGVAAWSASCEGLVTFNGGTFDVPLIETRFLFHRLAFPLADLPHLDMLHPARRLWKARPSVAAPPLDDESCRLGVLERHLAGVYRVGDVPGFEIPSRYFQFVRDGDARPLEAVLEHNRLDLLSLAAVTAHAFALVDRGPSAAAHANECLGLGRVYERAGRMAEAEACFAEAADRAGRVGLEPFTRAEALRRLALCRRRSGRTQAAADAWRALAELPGCPAALRREAREALAIHYEHRARDFAAARSFALDLLSDGGAERWRAGVEHRLRRLERKLERPRGALIAALDES